MNAQFPVAVRIAAVSLVRDRLRNGHEIALLDLREEGPFAAAHPLFAVNLPLGRIEERIGGLVPRRDAPIVLYDDGEGRVARALPVLAALGYTDVSVLEGGLEGWREAGGEVFIDVNVPSKAFGELVEHVRGTPSIAAGELHARLERGEDIVVLDARRFGEYNTMSIPTARSVPGAELALRVRDLAPSPDTTVVVNCAGRTRSIIGTQSLVNAGIPNPVFALRNGTIGWTLAGLQLDHGATRRAGAPSAHNVDRARAAARSLAHRAGVREIGRTALDLLAAQAGRTLYRLDVRSPEEYETEHLKGFRSAPGGQLVQATDEWIGVRHGTIVLADDDGVRARMTGHWLRQLGWREVYVLHDWAALPRATGPEPVVLAAPLPEVETVGVLELAAELETPHAPVVIDLAPSPTFRRGHVPGAVFAIRSDLPAQAWEKGAGIVLTCPDGLGARIAAPDLHKQGVPVRVLAGGTRSWHDAGLPLETGLDENRALSRADDVYKRPYEGTDNATAAMQAYLDWEFGLVAQLERDGTHGFTVLEDVPCQS
ncbi:rhodanese-related sulfurtransferase [Komagataeibacter sp. AV436]|uniref:Rhodanese-related sulfurtransferase n=1 Tax=Komagataeibacter melomenusus TaxID=2766578 RepID=A0ABX2AAG7_9PROT|nr:rhodanese-like domain-containing protein [Komagataeibacter melomenusus]MBV1829849.1 rhodanese-related sulfurtransferase [Komagataeibacter melomenusus]NPC65337.1 rhodanese-related sulfurtransferase [Komagataeibacter melomenusus]